MACCTASLSAAVYDIMCYLPVEWYARAEHRPKRVFPLADTSYLFRRECDLLFMVDMADMVMLQPKLASSMFLILFLEHWWAICLKDFPGTPTQNLFQNRVGRNVTADYSFSHLMDTHLLTGFCKT